MNNYDAFLFDWDGTIARTIEIWVEGMVHYCRQYGVGMTDRQIKQHFGDWRSPTYFGLPEDKLEEFTAQLEVRVHKKLPYTQLFKNALAVVDSLKASGKKLALITSSRKQTLNLFVEKYDLSRRFELIVTVEDVKAYKPDPESIELALKKLAAPKAHALVLGDSEKDLLAAQNAGVDSLLFYPKSHQDLFDLKHLKSFKPKYIVHTWKELLDQS